MKTIKDVIISLLLALFLAPSFALAAPVAAKYFGPIKPYRDAMTLIGNLTINGQPAPVETEIAAYGADGALVGISGIDFANGSSFILSINGPAKGPYHFAVYHPATGEISEDYLTFGAFDGKIDPPGLNPPDLTLHFKSLQLNGVNVNAETAFSLK